MEMEGTDIDRSRKRQGVRERHRERHRQKET